MIKEFLLECIHCIFTVLLNFADAIRILIEDYWKIIIVLVSLMIIFTVLLILNLVVGLTVILLWNLYMVSVVGKSKEKWLRITKIMAVYLYCVGVASLVNLSMSDEIHALWYPSMIVVSAISLGLVLSKRLVPETGFKRKFVFLYISLFFAIVCAVGHPFVLLILALMFFLIYEARNEYLKS